MASKFDETLLASPVDDNRRSRKGIVAVVVGALVVLLAVAAVLASSGSRAEPEATPGSSLPGDGASTLEEEPTSTTGVAGPIVLSEDPVVLQASYGPKPLFDVAGLGEDQTLIRADGLMLDEEAWFDEYAGMLAVDERLGIGTAPGSRYRTLSMSGTIRDPFMGSYDAPGVCYRIPWFDESLVDCFGYESSAGPRSLFMNLDDPDDPNHPDFVAWGLLPEEASVLVLSVNGDDVAWQRPVGSTALFMYAPQRGDDIMLRVLNSAGSEILTAKRNWPPPEPPAAVEPILGYGDFSDLPYRQVDPDQVHALVVACMRDQGVADADIPPTLSDDTDTLSEWLARPDDERRAIDTVHARCRAGLGLPAHRREAGDRLTSQYEMSLQMYECFDEAGFEIESPPPLGQWATHLPDDRWDPFELLSDPDTREAAGEAMVACFPDGIEIITDP